MKFNLNLKSTKTKKLKKTDASELNAVKYWNILVIIFFVLFLAGAVYGYISFTNLDKKLFAPQQDVDSQNNFKQEKEISDVINYLENKEDKKNFLLKESGVIDPSL